MVGRLTRMLAVVAMFSLSWGVARSDTLPPARDSWIRVDTRHFDLISNASRQRTLKIGENLERLREVLAHTSAGMNTQSPLPTLIYVFRDSGSFAPYNTGLDGRPNNWSGYFVSSRSGNYVAVDASAGEAPFSVIYHEYLHYFLRNNLPSIPLWLNEGLAEFYSNFAVRGGRAEIGGPIDRHLAWLASHRMIPLEQLFRLDTDSSDYNEGTRQGTIYAQSWALTHYLLADDKRRTQTGRYLNLLNRSADPLEAFETAFETDLASVEKALEHYVRRESYRFYRYTLEDRRRIDKAAVRPLTREETLFRLGDLLAHQPAERFSAAEEHLHAVLALDPEHASAYASLALLRLRQDRLDEAVDLGRRSLELHSEGVQAHSILGRALMQRFLDSGETGDLLGAREQFETTRRLSPTDAENLADLGKTFLFGHGDAREGIDALTLAAELMPTRTDILIELIALTAHEVDTGSARRLLEASLSNRANPKLAAAAEMIIVEVDIKRAMVLIREGRQEEAVTLVRAAAHQTRNPRIKLTLLTRLVRISTELASNSSIDKFNEAVGMAKHGEMDTAAELLEELVRSTNHPDLRAAAETHLTEIRRTLGHNALVDRFNQAVREARRGNIARATTILEGVLDAAPEDRLRSDTLQLLNSLRSAAPDSFERPAAR